MLSPFFGFWSRFMSLTENMMWSAILKGGTNNTLYKCLESVTEKAMAPHSSTLAWKIPWTEEPGGLQSMGSQRVKHNWTTSLSLLTFMHWRRKMAAHSSGLAWRIPVTGEPGGLPSMGSPRVGHDWSNLAAAAGSVNKGIRANYPQMMVIRSYLGIREQSHEELLSKIKMENNNTWWHTSPGYSFCFYEILLRPPSRLNSL